MGNRKSRVGAVEIYTTQYQDNYLENSNNDKLYLENLKYIIKKNNPEIKYYIENNINFIWDTTFRDKKLTISNHNIKNDINIIITNQISFSQFKPKFPDFFENKECSICLEPTNKISCGKEMPVCLHCDHVFHYKCISEWYNNNSSCPVCRETISVPINTDDSFIIESENVV